MEGKGITELSDAGTAAGERPRFSCHFEENSISFCDLLRAKDKVMGPGQASGIYKLGMSGLSSWRGLSKHINLLHVKAELSHPSPRVSLGTSWNSLQTSSQLARAPICRLEVKAKALPSEEGNEMFSGSLGELTSNPSCGSHKLKESDESQHRPEKMPAYTTKYSFKFGKMGTHQ